MVEQVEQGSNFDLEDAADDHYRLFTSYRPGFLNAEVTYRKLTNEVEAMLWRSHFQYRYRCSYLTSRLTHDSPMLHDSRLASFQTPSNLYLLYIFHDISI